MENEEKQGVVLNRPPPSGTKPVDETRIVREQRSSNREGIDSSFIFGGGGKRMRLKVLFSSGICIKMMMMMIMKMKLDEGKGGDGREEEQRVGIRKKIL